MKRKLFLLIFLAMALVLLSRTSTGVAKAQAPEEQSGTNVEELLEEVDLSGLTDYFDTLNDDQRAVFGGDLKAYLTNIVSGKMKADYGSILQYVGSAIGISIVKILPLVLSIIVSQILISIVSGVKGSFSSHSVDTIVSFAGTALVSIMVTLQVFNLVRDVSSFVSGLRTQMEAVFPILFTMMTALGASGSIAVYQPAVAMLSFSVTQLICAIALPMIIITIVFSIIGNLSPTTKLGGMSKFFVSTAKWILYTTFFIFLSFLSVQGITAAVSDSISVRSAKFALSKYVPVIGGYLSEGFNLILAGSVLIKNAVGLTAIIMIFISAIPLLVSVIITSLSFKLSAALCEPFEGGKIGGLLNSVSSSVSLLSAIICGLTFLYFVFILLIILSGNLVL